MTPQTRSQPLSPGDLAILAYAQHMAETARSDAARSLFQSYVEEETRRLRQQASDRTAVAGYTAKYLAWG